MSEKLFTEADQELLLTLLETNTASPMETGKLPAVAVGQKLYAANARRLGFEVVHHEPPSLASISGEFVPLPVRETAQRLGAAAFLESQPNLVLRLGPPRPLSQTLMLNFHMDTVGGEVPIQLEQGRITGRGAADMKGAGVALLAGVREALRRDPTLTNRVTILIQCPAGEEGGAMGIHGTRVVTGLGFVGSLNVFAEPSGGVFFDHATCTMTARVEVTGQDSTDDEPDAGHNATVLLGFLAQHICGEIADRIEAGGGKLCVAGIHTGDMHNRVYGKGSLLLNFAYRSTGQGRQIESWVEDSMACGCSEFARRFERYSVIRRTAQDVSEVCHLTWLKRGLPPLANRDEHMERLLARAGLHRNPDDRPDLCFTCDAIWGQGPGRYSVVFGPGSLGTNGCHTEREFIDIADLESYARQIANLIIIFAAEVG